MRRAEIEEVRAELVNLARTSTTRAAMLAHELRNPLAAISLYLEEIEDELGDNHEGRRLCRTVDRQLDHLFVLIESYLADARSQQVDSVTAARIDALCARLSRRRFLDWLLR